MQKIALITGITGQDGSYLAEMLLDQDYIVFGILRRSSTFNTERIEDIFDQFGFEITEEYQDILLAETINARQYSNHRYSPSEMGIDLERIKEDFGPITGPLLKTSAGKKKTESIQ